MTDIERELRKILCDALTVNDDKGAHLNLSLVDKLEAKILPFLADREKAAFERGRIAEAKICEEAQRHA